MKKLRFGVVGLGRLGRRHAENVAYRIRNAELTAVCSLCEDEVRAAQDGLGVKHGYTNYEEMLKNAQLDAMLIASSSSEHAWQIEAALKAGLHVFSEKPLGLTLDECIRTEEAVQRYPDQVFMLGFMRRYDKSYAYAKQKIDMGAIGTPIVVRCYGLDPVEALGGATEFAAKSGGIFLDMAIHDFDLGRWFLDSEARSVFATGGCYVSEDFAQHGDVDNATALIEFQNSAMAMFYVSRTCVHGYHIETEIIGTEGSLRVGSTPVKNLVTVFDKRGAVRECSTGFLERFEEAYINEIQEFTNCVLERRQPQVTVYDGTMSTRLAYAAKESLEQRRLVSLN